MTIEDASKKAFREFLTNLDNSHNLRRIVVDEVHCVKNWASFREKCLLLPSVRCVPVQMVLLSASLPPAQENDYRILFGCNFTTLRAPTTRDRISYQVEVTDDCEAKLQTILTHVLKLTGTRIVVFCHSKRDVTKLFHFYKVCEPSSLEYTSEVKSSPEELGSSRLIFATSALSMGVNLGSISHVFHYRGFHSLTDYAQESGRGGRTGSACVSKIILTVNDIGNEEYLKNNSQCRRYLLQKHMDGRGTHCLWGDFELCDICENSMLQEEPSSLEFLSVETLPSSDKISDLINSSFQNNELSLFSDPPSSQMEPLRVPEKVYPSMDTNLGPRKKIKISANLHKAAEIKDAKKVQARKFEDVTEILSFLGVSNLIEVLID